MDGMKIIGKNMWRNRDGIHIVTIRCETSPYSDDCRWKYGLFVVLMNFKLGILIGRKA